MGGRLRSLDRRSRRRGFGLLDVIVVVLLLGAILALLLPTVGVGNESGRQNTCRNNLRQLSLALFQYANKTTANELPGYINALEREDTFAYHDPRTGRVEPVSWVVMILPELDRQTLYEQWRSGTVSQGGGPQAGARIGSPAMESTKVYLEFLICPSDPQPNRTGTPTCYAVNAGIQDNLPSGLRRRQADCFCAACNAEASQGGPPKLLPARDHWANGVFFDAFTSSKHFDPATRPRGVVSTFSGIVDPKDKTILLTENVDSVDYTLDPEDPKSPVVDELYPWAEQRLAVLWFPTSAITPSQATGVAPTMTPPVLSNRINVDAGLGDGISYNYARPSSRHPNGINVAFAGSQVQFMRETISYYVYAKLMASDDANASTRDVRGVPTPMPDVFRTYILTDADWDP